MKRLILTTFLCFIVCMNYSMNALAIDVGGVGGTGSAVGSGIDPRTDSRYKDAFDLNCEKYGGYDSDMQILRESKDTVYKDVVIKFTKDYDGKRYTLKGYLRLYYIQEDYNNPAGLISKGTNAAVGTEYFDLVFSKAKTFYYVVATENYDGTFSMTNVVENTSSRAMWTWLENLTIESSDIPLFDNLTDAKYYSETNQVRNALYDPDPKDYSSELYFKSFEVIPHVTNNVDAYYFDIKYELSDYAKQNLDKLNLNFQNKYEISLHNSYITDKKWTLGSKWYALSIPLKDKPYGFSIYLNDLPSIDYALSSEALGLTPYIIFGDRGVLVNLLNSYVHDLIGEDVDVATVDNSFLYFKFNLRFSDNNGVVLGKRNDFTYDLLDNVLEKSIYAPNTTTDSDGNTTVNKDNDGNITYTQEGDKVTSSDYYYNNVTTGDDGTTVNNYFYYDKDGNKKEISEKEYKDNAFTVVNAGGGDAKAEGGNAVANATIGDININVGNNNGEYISLSPTDFNMFIKGIEDLLKQFDVKGGLFNLLSDTFSMFPDKVTVIAVGAISVVAVASLICILRR